MKGEKTKPGIRRKEEQAAILQGITITGTVLESGV
jgi:hypothetical protein